MASGSTRRKAYIKSLADNVEILLPVTPFIMWSEGVNTSSQDLFGFGEIDNGATSKLCTFTAESFFPHQDNNYDFIFTNENTNYYINWLYRWLHDQHKLLFTYCTDSQNIRQISCKIAGFDFGEKDGSKNIHYSLKFREYKELKIDGQNIVNSTGIAKSYGNSTYYVGEGDTLVTIAAKIYGDSSKWSYLMTKNNLKNPIDIKLGQGLKL